MKIAHVLHPYQPNLGYQENYLPAKQRQLGHDVRIFTSNIKTNNNMSKYSQERYQYKGVPTVRLDTRFSINSVGEAFLKGLRSELKKYKPEIIHAHGHMSIPSIQSLGYSILSESELFVDCHVDNDNFHLDNFMKKSAFEFYKTILLPVLKHNVKRFLPVNPYAQDFLTENLDIPPSQQSILPLGVDTSVFNPGTSGEDIREQYLSDNSSTLFLFVGYIDQTKDVDVLIKAFGEVVKSNPDSFLLIVGPLRNEDQADFGPLSDTSHIDDHIEFTGAVEHRRLPEFYNAADIGVWPGKLGISIIEALGCGLPIIVCDSSATDFLISNNGETFPRGDAAELAKKMEKLSLNNELQNKMGKNSLELANKELSWDGIARKSIEIYSL